MILIVNSSVPKAFKIIPHIIDSNGVCTILKSLYGINPFAMFLAKLKFQISSRLFNSLGNIIPAIIIANMQKIARSFNIFFILNSFLL